MMSLSQRSTFRGVASAFGVLAVFVFGVLCFFDGLRSKEALARFSKQSSSNMATANALIGELNKFGSALESVFDDRLGDAISSANTMATSVDNQTSAALWTMQNIWLAVGRFQNLRVPEETLHVAASTQALWLQALADSVRHLHNRGLSSVSFAQMQLLSDRLFIEPSMRSRANDILFRLDPAKGVKKGLIGSTGDNSHSS